MELFNKERKRPLAAIMRPQSFKEFIGQRHLFGPNGIITRVLAAKRIPSLILYGPPGTGKTSLALLLAKEFQMRFVYLNAATSGVKELRETLSGAQLRFESGHQTLLFVDEIQRFNATQQQVLLPFVEEGSVIFVGASVENPMFVLLPALNSRCLVVELKRLSEDDIVKALRRAIGCIGGKDISDEVLGAIARASDGDLRKAYNILELAYAGKDSLALADVETIIGKKIVYYDRKGDQHYDTVSSFIKAMRASDEASATYWLSKMLYAGEDPRFIARRMIIFASEDIGMADPNALNIAVSAYNALQVVGLPEAEFNLMHACVYLCRAPKSREIKEILSSHQERITQEITSTPAKFLS